MYLGGENGLNSGLKVAIPTARAGLREQSPPFPTLSGAWRGLRGSARNKAARSSTSTLTHLDGIEIKMFLEQSYRAVGPPQFPSFVKKRLCVKEEHSCGKAHTHV